MPFGNAARIVERQVAGLERLGSQLTMAEEQVERVIKTQTATEARLGQSTEGTRAAPERR